MNLAELSKDELLARVHTLVGQGNVVLARLLAHLGEVEERRLDLEMACSSLFDFCVRRLGMGEDEACRRVTAARLVRRFPSALGMIERGQIHLTALLLLREHLTDENGEELLRAAAGKTKSEVQELVAARFPRPDVPARIQPMPMSAPFGGAPAPSSAPTRDRAVLEPLSPERYKVQFTASAELREKIARATDLLRHANPSGDLAVVVERALDLLIAQLEKQRLGKSKRPSAKPARKSTRRGYVPRAVRRAVFERDGEQCTYVDEEGRRCQARTLLELDHREPRALGGADDVDNLCVKCRRHNAFAAERAFGREHVEKKKAERKDPLQRGSKYERALVALRGMGFKEQEARRALAIVTERLGGMQAPIETVLREALAILT